MSLGFSDEENVPGIGAVTGYDLAKDDIASLNRRADKVIKEVNELVSASHTHSDQFVYFDGENNNFNHISKFYAPTVQYSVSDNETKTHLELDLEGFIDQVRVQKAIDFLHGKCEVSDEIKVEESLECFGVFWSTKEEFLECYNNKAKIGDIGVVVGGADERDFEKTVHFFDGKDWVKFRAERPDYSYIEECNHYEHETCLIVDRYMTHITYLEELLEEHGIEF